METVWSLSVRLGFNLVIRRNSYTLCLTSLLLRRFVFRRVRVERLGDEPQGTMGRVLPAFLCARERDVWVRGRCLTIVFGFLFVSDYTIRLSTRLLT